jgi:DNA helicase-2/ATP-dependent DNA helicase PcrA
VISLERNDTDEEAAAVLELIATILGDPNVTVGVVGRRGTRSRAIRDVADQAGVPFEDWSTPTHVPGVVELLNRASPEALNIGGTDDEILDILERLCRELVDPADAFTLDELANACDALRHMVSEGVTVAEAIASCRPSPAPGAPVAPGLHLLTGHKGKGQEFDWVFVVGLEQGHIPDFHSETDEAIAEELRVLHVMVSRARYGVVVTHSRYTPTRSGWRETTPSQWLELLQGTATTTDHK